MTITVKVLWWLRDQAWLDLKELWNSHIIHTLLEIIALLPKAKSYASLSRPPVPDIALDFRFVLPSLLKNVMDLDSIPLQSHSPGKLYSAGMAEADDISTYNFFRDNTHHSLWNRRAQAHHPEDTTHQPHHARWVSNQLLRQRARPEKKEHYIIKGTICREDVTITNVYISQNRSKNRIKGRKGQWHDYNKRCSHFISVIDKSRQKTHKRHRSAQHDQPPWPNWHSQTI